MGTTGEGDHPTACDVGAEGEPARSGGATLPKSSSFTRFSAQGFKAMDPLEADGPSMLKMLLGPTDVRKWALLGALDLFKSVLIHSVTDHGPPFGYVVPFPMGPMQVMALERAGVVLTADVVVSPEDVKVDGQTPKVLSLNRIGVSFSLGWDGSETTFQIRRFEVASGRNFAESGSRTVPEIQDLYLAVLILVNIVDTLLRSARTSRPLETPKSTLGERERRVLDIVAGYCLNEGVGAPMNEVLLSVPRGAAEQKAAGAATDALVKNGYLVRTREALCPSLAGLMACARAGEVAGVAHRLLDHITFRAGEERGRFTRYTPEELVAANVVGPDELALAAVVIALFRLGAWSGTAWSTPPDIVELRSVDDIQGLLARCEQLRRQDEARAAAEREARARQSAEAARRAAMAPSARERSDETWHRLRDWTQGQTRSEHLAAQILLRQGFTGIDPSHPRGGPDGGKDAICMKNGVRWIMAVYFPTKPQKFSAVRKKFLDDLRGVKANGVAGIAFVTNQELALEQREELKKAAHPAFVELYHLERIGMILNGPGSDTARLRKLFLDLE
jgi:hypothetical protein